MKLKNFAFLAVTLILSRELVGQEKEQPVEKNKSIYDFTVTTIDGKAKSLADYKGKVLMIVNVASKCGNTPQYKDLEEIFTSYKDRGFEILGFPANNFGRQEPGTNEEIKSFCTLNYDVTFDMFAKVSVKGDDQHPLYKFLTEETQVPGAVKWNFQKYLVDRKGNVVQRIEPKVQPTNKDVIEAIEKLLNQK